MEERIHARGCQAPPLSQPQPRKMVEDISKCPRGFFGPHSPPLQDPSPPTPKAVSHPHEVRPVSPQAYGYAHITQDPLPIFYSICPPNFPSPLGSGEPLKNRMGRVCRIWIAVKMEIIDTGDSVCQNVILVAELLNLMMVVKMEVSGRVWKV